MTGAREPATSFCGDALAPLGRCRRLSYRWHSSTQLRSTLIAMRADIYWIADTPSGRLAILGRPRSGDWLSDEIADWKAGRVGCSGSAASAGCPGRRGLATRLEGAREAGAGHR